MGVLKIPSFGIGFDQNLTGLALTEPLFGRAVFLSNFCSKVKEN
jgi:hypothetical protein